MAEEHGFQASEGHRLCANNCGFFGSSATQNLCSKCYRDFYLKEEQEKSAKSAVENSLFASCSVSPAELPSSSAETVPETAGDVMVAEPAVAVVARPVSQPNRCSECRKRVGLTGFRCRCGVTFCGTHRYPEQHRCTFDFKSLGREAIARENPVVKGEKLEKI